MRRILAASIVMTMTLSCASTKKRDARTQAPQPTEAAAAAPADAAVQTDAPPTDFVPIPPPAKVSGDTLKSSDLKATPNKVGTAPVVDVVATMDERAAYQVAFACTNTKPETCLPTRDAPRQFINAVRLVEFPGPEFTVFVRSCVKPEFANTPADNCGPAVATKEPLVIKPGAQTELAKELVDQKADVKEMQDACAQMIKEMHTIADANGVDPKIQTLASNIVNAQSAASCANTVIGEGGLPGAVPAGNGAGADAGTSTGTETGTATEAGTGAGGEGTGTVAGTPESGGEGGQGTGTVAGTPDPGGEGGQGTGTVAGTPESGGEGGEGTGTVAGTPESGGEGGAGGEGGQGGEGGGEPVASNPGGDDGTGGGGGGSGDRIGVNVAVGAMLGLGAILSVGGAVSVAFSYLPGRTQHEIVHNSLFEERTRSASPTSDGAASPGEDFKSATELGSQAEPRSRAGRGGSTAAAAAAAAASSASAGAAGTATAGGGRSAAGAAGAGAGAGAGAAGAGAGAGAGAKNPKSFLEGNKRVLSWAAIAGGVALMVGAAMVSNLALTDSNSPLHGIVPRLGAIGQRMQAISTRMQARDQRIDALTQAQ